LPAVNFPDDLAELPAEATEPAVARNELFQSAYLTDLATNPNNATIVAAKKQDLSGWKPKAPTILCGGAGDPTVKFNVNAQGLYDDFQSQGAADVSLVDVDPTIEAIYGSVLTDDPATYYKNYHGVYESPLCASEARKFFDQYK
jgi:hypothetical protein